MELERIEALAILRVTSCAFSESSLPKGIESVLIKIKELFKDDKEIQ